MTKLGKLERVDPRTIWKHEAHHFTPWLAENIDVLGDALGLELELEEQESAVGDFSLDILAKDLGRNKVVVIENQLAPTDHTHLGQLITYAAGHEAGVVIWISPELREEHRQAIDWLNRGDGAETEYFAVVVELLQIDGSKPAVNFRVAASPNDWSRRTRRAHSGPITGKRADYQQFFQLLIDELREKHRFTNSREAQPQNWYAFGSGTRGFSFCVTFVRTNELRVELYIDLGDEDDNVAAFDALQATQPKLEKAFGEPLRWERLDNRRACRVACYRPGTIHDPADQLDAHRKWAIERLLKFRAAFGEAVARVAAQLRKED